jgi:glycerophosphoryl diester phosphodiesterase
MPDVITIAHRGDPIGARENTPAAFASAAALGADWVELDLRLTRDGEVVVLHDQSLERLWGRDVSVCDVDLAEVRRLGDGDVRIPTLAEVLAALQLPLMIDFTRREVVTGALDAVRAADALERSLFVTGNVDALRVLRRLCDDARIGLTWTEGAVPPAGLLDELGAEYWNPMFHLVTAAGVDAAHDLGRRVSTWTVDREEDMERVVQTGVDAVVSNRIGDLLRFLGRR